MLSTMLQVSHINRRGPFYKSEVGLKVQKSLTTAVFLNRRTYSYSEPQLYSQNSGGSYFDTQGSSSQVSTVVTSHGMANNGSGGNGGMSMGLPGGQVIGGASGSYLMDNAGAHPSAQTARASPATVSGPTSEPPTTPTPTVYSLSELYFHM